MKFVHKVHKQTDRQTDEQREIEWIQNTTNATDKI